MVLLVGCVDVVDIDFDAKKIKAHSIGGGKKKFELDYDKLIIGVGADNNTFGVPGVVSENVHFLKELKHARAIREKVIALFEEASLPGLTSEEIRKKLHFVVVGGGPTCVEV